MTCAPILTDEEQAVAKERAAAVAYIGKRKQAVATAVSKGVISADDAALLTAHYETLAGDLAQGLHVGGVAG